MSLSQRIREGAPLRRNTVVEIAGTTSPLAICLTVVVVLFPAPVRLLGWFTCGLLGLCTTVGLSRASAVGYSPLEWPRPETNGDLAVNAIAYNGVLILGTILGQVVWSVSTSLLLAGGTSTILPFWFLKHIHLLVFLAEE